MHWTSWIVNQGQNMETGGNHTLIAVTVLGGLVTLYIGYAYNDLSRRLERLKRLYVDVRRVRAYRRGVSHVVSRHLARITRHERGVTGLAARRGRNGRFITDLSNGWPDVAAVSPASQGMTADVQSQGLERDAYSQLNSEAEMYNALIRTFPRRLVGDAFGFRAWRFGLRQRTQHVQRRGWRS
jgi:hypothetical protein